MGAAELIGLAASVSLLSGWRLYLCVFATGLAMRTGWIALPAHLDQLAILSHNWVLGAAGFGLVAEFLADKVAWVDSVWDAVHTIVRPLGGALLALAIVDASDPAWQVAAFLLGGGGALVTHAAKASARAVVNASPEPYSNMLVSGAEDVGTLGLLGLAFANPVAAVLVAILVLAFAVLLFVYARRAMRQLMAMRDRMFPPRPPPARDGDNPINRSS